MKKNYRVTLFVLLCMAFLPAKAGRISGYVTDMDKHPLSFASVYVKNTTNGVTTNNDGYYELNVDPGVWEIEFAYVGYIKKSITITLGNTPLALDMQLENEAQQIKPVQVASGEDPAYAVIRAAIRKRKFYLNQVEAYSCGVYIKGMQRLDSIPKKIMLINADKVGLDSSMLGIVYLSESESQYNFKQPDKVKEVMVSSKVSGDNKAFSWNSASDFDFNFYKNSMSMGTLSDREFISPISETAMLYYKYHLVGAYVEDGQIINKIQVIPRHSNGPVFGGYLYIVDGSWRIHSTDLWLTKESNIDFVDSLEVRQSFAKANDTIFMPINQTLLFRFTALGIKGKGRFVGIFRNYNMSPSFPKKFFKGEEMHVNEDANKKDSAYWDLNRPVPLTREELDDYRKKDSIARHQQSKKYLDSVDLKHNKFSLSDLVTGYSFYRRSTKTTYRCSGILPFLNYNTVQGWAPSLNLEYFRELKDNRRISVRSSWQYGLGNRRLNAAAAVWLLMKPEKFRWITISGGREAAQFNGSNPISPLINTIYTLEDGKNFMKLYQRTYFQATYLSELANGINLALRSSYNWRSPLRNIAHPYSLDKTPEFTVNYPFYLNEYLTEPTFADYSSLLLSARLTLHYKQKYYTRPHEKIISGSRYPALILTYTKGLPVLGSNQDFDELEAELTGDLHFGVFGTSQFSVGGGRFLRNQVVGLAELKHFNGNQTILAPANHMAAFQLLDYYAYSTCNWYLEGHYEHHFNGFFLNHIPLLKKLKWYEVAGAHYLYNPNIRYAELSVGLEHIFKFLRIDFVTSYSNTQQLRAGVLIGLQLNGAISIN